MKRTYYSFIVLLASACQPQARTEPTQAVREPVSVVGSASAAPLAKTAPATASLAPVESLTPEMQRVFQAHDLSPLLQTVNSANAHAQNGFFGPDHYRIEVAFTEVRRDPAHPTVYFLRGKDRYKGRITPFSGIFTVNRFGEQPPYSAAQLAESQQEKYDLTNDPNLFATEGYFELREDSTYRGAGIFRGRLNVDWAVNEDKSLALNIRNEQSLSVRGLIKYEGTWTNGTTHRSYPVVWVEDIFSYSNQHQVLNEFTIGERDVDFNPKYAKLGWNSYWENQEWWAESSRPAAVHLPPVPSDMTAAPVVAADSLLAKQ